MLCNVIRYKLEYCSTSTNQTNDNQHFKKIKYFMQKKMWQRETYGLSEQSL